MEPHKHEEISRNTPQIKKTASPSALSSDRAAEKERNMEKTWYYNKHIVNILYIIQIYIHTYTHIYFIRQKEADLQVQYKTLAVGEGEGVGEFINTFYLFIRPFYLSIRIQDKVVADVQPFVVIGICNFRPAIYDL